MVTNKVNIKKAFRLCLANHTKTQAQVAADLNITESWLSQVVNRKAGVSILFIEELSDYFSMPASEFIALGE